MNQYNESGQKHGYWEVYYPNGTLWYKGNFINDRMNGYWENYYSNGNISGKGNYIDGELDSYWEFYSYYTDGELNKKSYYI